MFCLALRAPARPPLSTMKRSRQGGTYVTVRDYPDLRTAGPNGAIQLSSSTGWTRPARGPPTDGHPWTASAPNSTDWGARGSRLACREADWFGANDSDHLKTVSPDGAVTVLRLEPLTGEDVRLDPAGRTSASTIPEDFIASARGKGVQGLLANPQSLKMLAVAVGSDGVWPWHQDAGLRHGVPHPAG